MKYLITGAAGMLGQDLQAAFAGRSVTALSRADLDIGNLEAVMDAVAGHDVVINAAAYTKVDDAETDEAAAYAVNATGARNLAIAAAAAGARLVQVSTDYVFNGRAATPYSEAAPLNPISAYGRTKAAGEQFVMERNPGASFIVRTAWLYGKHGPNFARTMLRLAEANETLSVVNDQLGQPTWTFDLAHQILGLLDSDAPAGVYHGTNSGETTWFGFARAIFAASGLDPDRVKPTDSSAFRRPAPRPAYSVLGHEDWEKVELHPMRSWEAALTEAASVGALGSPEGAQ